MRRATVADRNAVVNILTSAFRDNKSVNYVVRQGRERMERISKLMEYSFDVCEKFGEVWMSNEGEACALILFPDLKRTTIRTLLWDVKLVVSVIGIHRVGAVLKRESMIKSFHPSEAISYLWFIGVSPLDQHKGIGTSFLREIIHECKTKRRPIYLETSVEKNIRWYRQFDFEVFHSLEFSYTLYLLRKVL